MNETLKPNPLRLFNNLGTFEFRLQTDGWYVFHSLHRTGFDSPTEFKDLSVPEQNSGWREFDQWKRYGDRR